MAVIHRLLAPLRNALLVVLAAGLWLNTLAPAGYMIAPSGEGWLTVSPCPETHPLAQSSPMIEMDHAAMGHDHEESSSSAHSKPCAFAGVVKLATGPVDFDLLIASIAFAMLLAFAPRAPLRLRRSVHLRPPLRGPPVLT